MIIISDIKKLYHRKSPLFKFLSICFLLTLSLSSYEDGVYLWILIPFLILTLNFKFKLKNDKIGILIIVWSIIYFLSTIVLKSGGAGSMTLTYILSPYACYTFGKYSMKCMKGETENSETLIILCVVAYSLNLWYLTLTNVIQFGIISKDALLRQFVVDGAEVELSATLFGLMASVALSGIPLIYITYTQKSIRFDRIDIIFFIAGMLSLLATIHLVNRTGLVILIAAFLSMLMYVSKDKISTFVFRILLIAIILYIIAINIPILSDIIDAYNNRLETESTEIGNAGGRSNNWIDAIFRIFYMPLGWYGRDNLTGYLYVHNLWLDVGRQSGLIPFLLITIITIMSLLNLWKLWKFPVNKLVLIFTGLNTTFFLGAFVEPVMEGQPYFAYFYIFIWGMQNQYLRLLKRSYKRNKNVMAPKIIEQKEVLPIKT